jgi:hypothetical protein
MGARLENAEHAEISDHPEQLRKYPEWRHSFRMFSNFPIVRIKLLNSSLCCYHLNFFAQRLPESYIGLERLAIACTV